MTTRILITIFILSVVRTAIGQSAFNTKTFHAHEQVCNFIGTTEYDYLIQLKEDSSVTFTVYSTDFRSRYKTVIKEVYEGQYSRHGNSIKAIFIKYNSFTKKKGDKLIMSSTKQDRPDKLNRVILFNLTGENINPLNSYIPTMTKSSPLRYDWFARKFDLWQTKELTDPEIFGLNN